LAVRQVIPPVFQLFIAICDCFTLVLSKSFPVQIQIRIDNFTAMNDLTISELIKFHGEEQGDSPALIYAGNTTCYTELISMGQRAARGLSNLGVSHGDRVAFWLPNCPAYVVLYLACAQLGAIAVAVNTRFRSTEVADILSRSGATCLIIWPDFRDINFLQILEELDKTALQNLRTIICYGEEETPSELSPFPSQIEKITYSELVQSQPLLKNHSTPTSGCNIFTTSGTTKAPKFVLHTHQSITNHALAIWRNLEQIIDNGVFFHTLPFCGVFGFNHLSAALAGGKASVIQSAFDAIDAVALIDKYQVHYLSATDDMLLTLLDADLRDSAMPSLVCCGYGAFNLPAEEITKKARQKGVTLVGLYGMSEVQALYARRSHELTPGLRYLPGGKLVSRQAKVRVRNPDTGDLLPHNQSGELEFKGPSLMKEYFGDQPATSESFTNDGYLRSGDLGYTTSKSEFVFEARMGDTLRLGGYLVSPAEIENVITEYKAIEAAQVVAVRVSNKMQPYGFVVAKNDMEINDELLRAHCEERIAKFKVPVAFQCIAQFPTTKSPNGTKIQRAKLRQMAEEALEYDALD
jgi:fatty-acyl-CoA synthase